MQARHTTLSIATACLTAITSLASVAHADEAMKDDTWVTLSGTVVSTEPDQFRLDYGDGVITVEMDDFDFYPDGKGLLVNDEVVVTGVVDDDLFERKTIEASTVYVENLGTYFYASAADEEDFAAWSQPTPIVVGAMQVTGTVTSVDGREFTVATGLGKVEVDTASMAINPMDDKGFLRVQVGDRVKVSGHIDKDLFDNHELSADVITKLQS